MSSHCRSCGASIDWIETPTGKKHPIDSKPEKRWVPFKQQSAAYDAGEWEEWRLVDTYSSHFSTCPDAKSWSGHGT